MLEAVKVVEFLGVGIAMIVAFPLGVCAIWRLLLAKRVFASSVFAHVKQNET